MSSAVDIDVEDNWCIVDENAVLTEIKCTDPSLSETPLPLSQPQETEKPEISPSFSCPLPSQPLPSQSQSFFPQSLQPNAHYASQSSTRQKYGAASFYTTSQPKKRWNRPQPRHHKWLKCLACCFVTAIIVLAI